MPSKQMSLEDIEVPDGATLHQLLFPVGPRQEAAIEQVGGEGNPSVSFHAFHQGIAKGLEDVVSDTGASGSVAQWLLLKDDSLAAEMLWGSVRDRSAFEGARELFAQEFAASTNVGDSYCRTVVPDLRHRLGEHYTPLWLVQRVVGRLPDHGIVADPACGDGRFLVALLKAGRSPEEIWGADLNPLAVIMARLNIWNVLGRPRSVPSTSVMWGDFVLASGAGHVPAPILAAASNVKQLPQANVYVGNPPWVTWRNLSEEYRQAIAGYMATSRLNHARGWAARVSAGQSDMAHIFVHEAVERLAPSGQVTFLLPRSTFKAPVGPGRLREGMSTTGRVYQFKTIWDCTLSDPFTGVRMDTVVAYIDVDRSQTFPVEWLVLSPNGASEKTNAAILSDPDDPCSPWLTGDTSDDKPLRLSGGERWVNLRARGGVNTGGGNSVFHVDVIATDGKTATIRNVLSRRTPTEVFIGDVETDYIRPLLRGRDIKAWHAEPSGHIVVPHAGEDLRKPVPEPELTRVAPLTYGYLARFKDLLASRKEVARWNAKTWYTLFRIGPYTVGCWRVVWPHSSNGQLRAAILAPDDATVPDQKVILVPFDDQDSALFLVALLNSPAVRRFVSKSAGMDASPNLLQRLVLPRFDASVDTHRRIAALAALMTEGGLEAEAELNRLVGALYAESG